jgi:predicted O-methyltransferase YrrM
MGGTMYDHIRDKTREFPFVGEYLEGELEQADFQRRVQEDRERLNRAGLSDWAVKLLSRFPPDQAAPAKRVLSGLASAGAIDTDQLDESGFETFRERVRSSFHHLPDRTTSIFPEETRVAYELSRVLRPRRVIVAGSYYLYFAIWLVPGIPRGGTVTCLDVDQTVCETAEKNVLALEAGDTVRVIRGDAEQYLSETEEPIDLLVIDAFGSKDNDSSRHRGKAIYGPMIEAALPHLSGGSVVLAHNAEENATELIDFYSALAEARLFIRAGTTENVGVYLL